MSACSVILIHTFIILQAYSHIVIDEQLRQTLADFNSQVADSDATRPYLIP